MLAAPPSYPPSPGGLPVDGSLTVDHLRAEIAALRSRIVELETAGARALPPRPIAVLEGDTFTASDEMLTESRALLAAVASFGPTVVFVKDVSGRYALINRRFSELFNQAPKEVFGKTDYELFPAEVAMRIRRTDENILREDKPHEYEGTIPTPHGDRTFSTLKIPVHGDRGDLVGLACFSSDITDLRRAEQERDAMQRRALEAHAAALRELEAPVVPIARGLVAIPLVGALDEERARRVEAVVLASVSERRASCVIIDVTGLRVLGDDAVFALSRMARGARLLGAMVLVTGMRPEAAKALGFSGREETDFIPLANLESGIAFALRARAPLAPRRPLT